MQSSTLEFATRPVPAVAPRQSVPARWVRQWLRVKLIVGLAVVLALLGVGAFGPLAAPYDPNVQDLGSSLVPPQWMTGTHVLGTDSLGRDILSRLMHGARVSLIIAFAVVVISGVVGVVLGATSGYYGGPGVFLLQKLVEGVWAVSPLLLAIAIITFLGQR